MVRAVDNTSKGVNVVAIGVVEGSVGAATTNADLLNQYASDGYSLYFPPGEYHIDRVVTFNSQTDIKLYGDGARIYQTNDLVRMFDFRNCDRVEVTGLTFHTAYFTTRTSAGGAAFSCCLWMNLCTNVNVHHNSVRGFHTHAFRFNGCAGLIVDSNSFTDGHWSPDPGTSNPELEDTACIMIWVEDGGTTKSKDVIITNNNCNTMVVNQIQMLHGIQKCIVSNNNLIARDENGNEITAYDALAPKSGIDVSYFAVTPYTGADDQDYDQYVISGNNIQGCRFAGISGQSVARASAVHPNVRGVIVNNNIRWCGTTQNTGLTSNLQGGIIWAGYRELVIANNTITNIPNDGGANGTSCISIMGIWARTDGSTNSGTPTSVNIQGNIISNSAARGIYVVSQSPGIAASNNSGDINIDNNIIQDIDGAEFIRVVVPVNTYRSGHVHITNNKIASTKTIGAYVCRVEMGSLGAGECMIANNTFNMQDANFTAQRAVLDIVTQEFLITGNRIKGDGQAGNAVGIDLRSTVSGERFTRALIADNQIDNCKIGVGSSSGTSYGPFLLSNCSLSNCGTTVEFPKSVKHGHWENSKAIMYEDVDPTNAPDAPEGTYLAGDIIFNTNMTQTGDALGWCYAGSGNWLPLVAVP